MGGVGNERDEACIGEEMTGGGLETIAIMMKLAELSISDDTCFLLPSGQETGVETRPAQGLKEIRAAWLCGI